MRTGIVICVASFVVSALAQQLRGRVAEQQLVQHLDHSLSPARRRDEEALKKFLMLLRRELLIWVLHFLGVHDLKRAVVLVPMPIHLAPHLLRSSYRRDYPGGPPAVPEHRA